MQRAQFALGTSLSWRVGQGAKTPDPGAQEFKGECLGIYERKGTMGTGPWNLSLPAATDTASIKASHWGTFGASSARRCCMPREPLSWQGGSFNC
jgi:hypothetical protein